MMLIRWNGLRAIQVIVAMAAAFAVVFAMHATASAHDGKVFHGKDFAYVSADHKSVSLCDEEKDGHGVSATIEYGFKRWYMDNNNGADGDCVTEDFSEPVDFVSICEDTKLCESGGF